MPSVPHNIAIETSSRQGSISLGRADDLLATVNLPTQRRHDVGLVASIAELCAQHDVAPGDLAELYVSIGPGSFTGLRVAVTVAKMLALAQGCRVVAVPTLEVLAQNVAADQALAVCLNQKHDSVYCAVYRKGEELLPPELRTVEQLLSAAPRPLSILGHPLPELPADPQVAVLDPALAHPRSEVVWRLGRELARQNRFVDPATLTPLYARQPEAVALWDKRHSPST